jgi:GDP-4-dehydro-6-deoxy-D-mannose reductase
VANALVTGASGFVGGHLISALNSAGHDVIGFDRVLPCPGHAAVGTRVVAGELRDAATVSRLINDGRVDWVFHLAAASGASSDLELYESNILGSAALLEAVHASQRSIRIVIVGSSAMYGDSSVDGGPVTELSLFKPVTAYGVSKAAVDLMAFQLFRRDGLPILRARPFNIVGPAQSPAFFCSAVAQQIAFAEMGQVQPVIHVRGVDTARDFVDVRDVALALIAIARDGIGGEAYNICSGVATPLGVVVDHLMDRAKVPMSIATDVPQPIGYPDVRTQCGSYIKLNAATGWTPQIALPQSLDDTLNYWRNNNR